MAEALISVLLEQLASIIHQEVQQQVKFVVDVKKEVANLKDNFRAIKAELKDAEERQVKEDSVKLWLDNLKDVSNEMEDVLDDWNSEILKLQIEKQEKEDGNALDTTKKENTKSGTELIERQKTTSFVNQTFGRVDEKELLVGKLLSESNPEGQIPIVIPIVGMGGIGKTTLSQLAYNDEKVKANFRKRIWVCVSDPFDELNIAKAIIVALDGNVNPMSNDLEAFFQCVSKSIEGKKFLLVLDDVWNQDYMKWEKLKLPLQNGAVGSKIIVTTRKEEVARMMGSAPDNTINLKVLSDENCWSLFAGIAFTNRNQVECQNLEPIGKEIVKKCKGLPLVAKTLGSLMHCKKTKKEWQDVLSSKIWELDIVEQQVFQPLLLSYYDLTPMIKRCLLYCVTFPKDHIIDKEVLIELWMSQGLFGSVGNKENTMIDIGELYFDNLVMRSFFQNFKKDEFGDIEKCQMHDIVHDFLQYLTKNECLIVEFKGGEERIELPNKLGHLTIMFAPYGPFPLSFDHCQRLRTITTFNCRITSLSRELILQLKCVRTLNLSHNLIEEVPDEVGVLVHLRYLDLSYNYRLKKLPDSLCNLVNLQTLRHDECRGLEKLPEAMGKLTSLQHLHAKDCEWLKKLPDSLCNLVNLQTLRVDGCRSLKKLPEAMEKLTSLQHLHAENCVGLEKLPDSLCNLVNLQTLRVDGCSSLKKLPEAMEKLTSLQHLHAKDCEWLKKLPDSLCNLVNLQTLRLDGCWNLKKLPEAMGKLTSLQHLHAQRIWHLKLPKSIARLKSLRTLDLDVIIGDEEGLRLSDLRDMDELQGKLEIRLVGKLKDSAASDAEKAKLVNKKHLLHLGLEFFCRDIDQSESAIQEAVLNALQPNSNLESLQIGSYSGSTLCPNWTSSLINLKSLTFSYCDVCKYVPLSVLGYLGSLERLRFEGMEQVKKVGFEYSLDHQVILFPNLKQLEFSFMMEWEEWDHHDENDATSSSPTCFMPRLSTLFFKWCPKLKTLPDFLRRSKTPLLQNLIIESCGILSQSCKDRQGPEWSKISHIPNIQIH